MKDDFQNGDIKDGTTCIIINGGRPLPGCVNNWNEAIDWQNKANENKIIDDLDWRFDCGYKLDFDGPLVYIDSRFYPPAEFYGPLWDGDVSLYIDNKEIIKKHFEEKSLNKLRDAVESYVKELIDKLKLCLVNSLKEL